MSVSFSDTTSDDRRPVAYARLSAALCLMFVVDASSRLTSSTLRTTGRRRGSRPLNLKTGRLLLATPRVATNYRDSGLVLLPEHGHLERTRGLRGRCGSSSHDRKIMVWKTQALCATLRTKQSEVCHEPAR